MYRFKCSELLVSVNTLAAIAAKLRLVHDGHPDIASCSQLDEIVDLVNQVCSTEWGSSHRLAFSLT